MGARGRAPVAALAAVAAVGVALACASVGAVAQDAAGPVAPGAPPSAGRVSAETIRDVEVMRRVLVKEGLGGVAPTDFARLTAYIDAVGAYSGSTSASEAFVVAGDGATFLLRTSDAVAPGEPRAEDRGPAAEPSAWDEAVADLEGRRRPVSTPKLRWTGSSYDAAKVDALRGRILDQLARFGDRVRGLAPTDHLTVVVVGRGEPVARLRAGVLGSDGEEVSGADVRDAATASLLRLGYVGGDARGQLVATYLTIRVVVSDCRAFARGTLDMDEFRRRAVIANY